MVNKNKIAGTSWETKLMTELREQGADVERLALAGDDEGDLIRIQFDG